MNIVITMHDAGMAANVGGGVESESYVIDVPDELIPPSVLAYVKDRDKYRYTAMTISFMRCSEEAEK